MIAASRSADAATADLSAVFKGADAVVSCVGVVPGGKNQLAGNGAVNVAIADAAAKSKVPKMVRARPKPPRPTPPRRSTSASRARSPTVRASSSSVRRRQFLRFPAPPLPTAGDYMKGKATEAIHNSKLTQALDNVRTLEGNVRMALAEKADAEATTVAATAAHEQIIAEMNAQFQLEKISSWYDGMRAAAPSK